jgi:hypothetical protein
MESGIRLSSQNEVRDFVRQRIEARSHWIFVHGLGEAIDFLSDIEGRYYNADANADFEVLLSPVGFSITLAHKRRMPARKLLRILKRHADSPSAAAAREKLGDCDILFVGKNPTALQYLFLEFIEPSSAWAAAMRN